MTTTVPINDNSMSSDSEESFLLRQLNKSQLLNTSSNSSSSERSRNAQFRRSYMSESYTEDNGPSRSFSVYQDVINETTDESRDISLTGITSLNVENLHNHNVLGELNPNNSSSSATDNGSSVSNSVKQGSGSLREFHLKSKSKKPLRNSDTSIHSSFNSARSSHYTPVPSAVKVADFAKTVNTVPILHSPVHISRHEELQYVQRIKTPNFLAPSHPDSDNLPRGSEDSELLLDESRRMELIKSGLYDEYQGGRQHSNSSSDMEVLLPLPPMPPILPITQTPKPSSYTDNRSRSDSSTSMSYKSAQSQMTRQSILYYEASRKKHVGRPNLLLLIRSDSQRKVTLDNREPNLKISTTQSPGITPEVDSTPTGSTDDNTDDASIREVRQARPTTKKQQFHMKLLQTKEERKNNSHARVDDKKVIDLEDGSSFSSESSYDVNEKLTEIGNPYNDRLLEKIYHYRSQPVSRNDSDTLAWILYLIAFLVPPLFFFLGLGLLDEHLRMKVSPQLKKLSLVTGAVVVIVSLAMIGVGFGYGITSVR